MLRYLQGLYFLVWECSLSLLLRIVCISFFMILFVFQEGYAASVPVTLPGIFGGGRNTCDPEFMDVLNDRAWMAAQREVTQNQNLIPRPDSVLEITCFDSFLDELGSHADDNFPSDPQWSEGGSIFGLSVIELIILVDKAALNAEPLLVAPIGTPTALFNGGNGSSGIIMTAALEVLVLDQLVDGVTVVGPIQDVITNPLMAACLGEGTKQYYLEHFSRRMLGNRAITTSAVLPSPGPAWAQILAGNSDGRVRDSGNYSGCSRMNDLWNRTKCYDFATESYRHTIIPNPPSPPNSPIIPVATPPGGEHDSFYTLETYRNMAAASDDYRTNEAECRIPTVDGSPDLPSLLEFACDLVVHHVPPTLTLASIVSIVTGLANNNPTWNSAYTGANPPPNATPATSNGGVDEYLHFLGLEDSTSCSALTPIKTGYIVSLATGVQYIDAICAAPGCRFVPPTTTAANGSCN
ncbi:MAG: hypothetical protein COA45_00980 [Zetaproteobacteria bacterium]|nr:MAG: hypothetical protein COA45_00980 [Zetaproteobacteria bacterium]